VRQGVRGVRSEEKKEEAGVKKKEAGVNLEVIP
jgi:hypothetical protein